MHAHGSVLAHTLERHGIATVQLASIRSYPERIRPPRALYCEFPLGRPLGRPGDPVFQRRVLEAAFRLLERPEVPVLEDFPERIEDKADSPLACPLPPRHDPELPAAVDEARALRPAYDRQFARSGRTTVGQAVDADGIPDAVAALVRIADGTTLEEAGLPGSTRAVGLDVRAYYEEAALAIADHGPAHGRRRAGSSRRRRLEPSCCERKQHCASTAHPSRSGVSWCPPRSRNHLLAEDGIFLSRPLTIATTVFHR